MLVSRKQELNQYFLPLSYKKTVKSARHQNKHFTIYLVLLDDFKSQRLKVQTKHMRVPGVVHYHIKFSRHVNVANFALKKNSQNFSDATVSIANIT